MSDLIERVLNHERKFVAAVLLAAMAASWLFVLQGAGTGMSVLAMTSWDMAIGAPGQFEIALASPAPWTSAYAAAMLVMWWVMMIAMMLPSAAPIILLYAKVVRGTRQRTGVAPDARLSLLFAAGYLAIWGLFSALAVSLQWSFEQTGLLSPFMMNTTGMVFAGIILVYAGAYQLSPLKQACLRHCQGPLTFLTHHWRQGYAGAFRMGLHHGLFCLGCCGGLMVILFFGGIMNLYWIMGLAVFVFVEKCTPAGPWLSYAMGAALLLWGLSFIVRGIFILA